MLIRKPSQVVSGKRIFLELAYNQAKYGKHVVSEDNESIQFHHLSCHAPEVLMQSIIKHAQDALSPYKDAGQGVPDASFTLQLPDEVYSGSNIYAVQKLFDGEFQFDVYFDSASTKQKLSGEC